MFLLVGPTAFPHSLLTLFTIGGASRGFSAPIAADSPSGPAVRKYGGNALL